VLNGIGGRTVREAKRNISQKEFVRWMQYRDRRGALNVGMRVEAAVAMLAVQVNRALGGTADVADFMPSWDRPAAEPVNEIASIDDLVEMMGAVKHE
jgi:hypothetical protein